MERKKLAAEGWPSTASAFGPNAGRLLFKLAVGCILFVSSAATAAGQQKYGLFIGVNDYPTGVNSLRGCVNDARKLQQTSINHYGFKPGNTLTLLNAEATRNNILSSAMKFQARAGAGDIFLFTFSGHGTLFPDANSEEMDETTEISMQGYYPPGKYDSAICPVDIRSNNSGKPWGNLILDDELYAVFSGFTRKGAVVIFVSDSCHSGTIGRDLKSDVSNKFLPLEVALGMPLSQIPRPAAARSVGTRDMQGRLLTLASSQDNETSLDYRDRETGEPTGLFTYVLVKVIEEMKSKNRPFTYATVNEMVGPVVARLASEQNSRQHPHIDSRFYEGDLNAPLFTMPTAATPATPPSQGLRVVVKVTDADGVPLAGTSLGIFGRGVNLAQGHVRREDAFALGRTNAKGIFDASRREDMGATNSTILIPPGRYVVKVVKEGYRTFIDEVEITEGSQPGFAVLSFRLAKE
jgi:hypothetical protein